MTLRRSFESNYCHSIQWFDSYPILCRPHLCHWKPSDYPKVRRSRRVTHATRWFNSIDFAMKQNTWTKLWTKQTTWTKQMTWTYNPEREKLFVDKLRRRGDSRSLYRQGMSREEIEALQLERAHLFGWNRPNLQKCFENFYENQFHSCGYYVIDGANLQSVQAFRYLHNEHMGTYGVFYKDTKVCFVGTTKRLGDRPFERLYAKKSLPLVEPLRTDDYSVIWVTIVRDYGWRHTWDNSGITMLIFRSTSKFRNVRDCKIRINRA